MSKATKKDQTATKGTTNSNGQANKMEGGKSKKAATNKFHWVKEYLQDKYNFRFNVLNELKEYKLIDDDQWIEIEEPDIYVEVREAGLTISQSDLSAILASSFVEKYNPVAHYMESLKPWDQKTDHIQKLSSYVKMRDKEHQARWELNFKKHLVRQIACALVPKVINKHMVILQGSKQHTGKTSFIQNLNPDELEDYFTQDINFHNKDDNLALTENWMALADEVSAVEKADQPRLKAIMSKVTDKNRRPHDKRQRRRTRIASFWGTANQEVFLVDETGNVRFIVFPVESIDWKGYSKDIDINNVWAQAYHLFKSGSFNYNLTDKEIYNNEIANQEFIVQTPEMQFITEFFEPGNSYDNDFFITGSDIVSLMVKAQYPRGYPGKAGKAMIALGFHRTTKRDKTKIFPRYGYYVKVPNQVQNLFVEDYFSRFLKT